MQLAAAIVVSCLVAGSATADPLPPPAESSSGNVELAVSLGGTLASWAVFVSTQYVCRDTCAHRTATLSVSGVGALGTLVAPGTGHWFEGHYITRGLVLRGIGVGVMLLGLAQVAQGIGENGDESAGALGALLFLGGGSLYLYGTVDDIKSVRGHVRARSQQPAVTLAPQLVRSGGGLAVLGSF